MSAWVRDLLSYALHWFDQASDQKAKRAADTKCIVLPLVPFKFSYLHRFKRNERDPNYSWRFYTSQHISISGLNISQSFHSDRMESWLAPGAPHISFLCSLWSLIISWALHQEPQIYRSMAINKTRIELDTGAQPTDYWVFIPLHAIGRWSLGWKKGRRASEKCGKQSRLDNKEEADSCQHGW